MRIEEIVMREERVCTCEIARQIGRESRSLINSMISLLIIRHGWHTRHEAGKVFIQARAEKIENTVKRHGTKEVVQVTAKQAPADQDWCVTCVKGSRERMYFDKAYTSDDARHTFAKVERVDFVDVRASRYRKIRSFRTMHNFR